MPQEQFNNARDEMDEITSFLDLPNEIIVDIFKYLDIPSRFKMRINKRLNLIQCSIQNMINHIRIAVS